MMVPFGDYRPVVEGPVYLAPGSYLVGQVYLGPRVSVWYNAVLRADTAEIRVGAETNIQDGCVLHVDGSTPTILGRGVTVGHRSIVHGADVADEVFIGMGAILMTGVKVGRHSIIGAGALLPEGMAVPERSVVVGVPARVVRSVRDEEIDTVIRGAIAHYRDLCQSLWSTDWGTD
ncbi:MAG: gamma carbonic anhydrase family protein [Firmicutes bacterium]|nr:gamma carbonic anhydrase family protein [Alicyclobacillaceae bacterium]MCL6498134.1 gamma carbonic anhydrase family protein [Bacillota bacterium]